MALKRSGPVRHGAIWQLLIPVGQSLAYYDVRTSVAGFGLTALGEPSLDQVYGLELVKR